MTNTRAGQHSLPDFFVCIARVSSITSQRLLSHAMSPNDIEKLKNGLLSSLNCCITHSHVRLAVKHVVLQTVMWPGSSWQSHLLCKALRPSTMGHIWKLHCCLSDCHRPRFGQGAMWSLTFQSLINSWRTARSECSAIADCGDQRWNQENILRPSMYRLV